MPDVYILKIEVPLRKRKRDPFLGYCHECVQSKEATPPRYQINYAIGASKRQPTPPQTIVISFLEDNQISSLLPNSWFSRNVKHHEIQI